MLVPNSSTSPIVDGASNESDISAMRQRLSELEEEIEHLRSRDVNEADASDQRIAELERLLKEKRNSEASLLSMLEEFQTRLDQQRLLIDQLMQKVDSPQAKSQS
jgi:acetyl-CoA carboxylase alpha subunit